MAEQHGHGERAVLATASFLTLGFYHHRDKLDDPRW